MRRAFVLLLIVFFAVQAEPSFGISFEPKEFDQLIAEAEQIFVGTATATKSRKLPAGAIVTDVTFTNLQVLKGNAGDAQFALMVLGGAVGGEKFEVPGIPRFVMGVTYLVFSQGNGTTIFPVVGGDQGMFQVKQDPGTNESFVFDSRGKPVANQSVRRAMPALSAPSQDPPPSPSPIPLDVFVQAVRSRLGA